MTVISKGAVLKKKVGNDVYIYQPYTHIDYVEGGLDQAEIENLINSAGYLDTSAVNAILESYYTKTEVDNKVTTLNNSITTTVNTHNSNTSAHSDIRTLISDLAERLNTLANSDDTTLDQMAEVVAYIKSNRGLIEGITTTKANKDYVDTELAKKANSANLSKVATSGSYNDLSNKPTIPTTLPANGGNADTVGGFTVGVNVPANAKFTDTTYSAMSASEATTGTATTARTITAKVLNDKINAIVSANAYSHPTYTAKTSGLYKFVVDKTGHISSASAVTKSDITALGIPAQDTVYSLPTASSTLGGVKTTSKVTSTSGLTACPIINGVPYYKDTKNTYTLSSFGVTATSSELNVLNGITVTTTELNYCDGVTSNIQTQLDSKLSTTEASNTYLGKTAKASSASVADSANSVAWDNVSGKPDSFAPASHNHASNTINTLTGYSKASSASALSTSDSLNTALGKLEKALDSKLSTSGTASKATADASGNVITSTYATKSELSDYVDLSSEQVITGTKDFANIACGGTIDLYASNQTLINARKIQWKVGTAVGGSISATQYTGNSASATKATNDSDGNKISTTYAKKSDTYTKTEVDNLIANSGGSDSGSNNLGYFTYSVSLEPNIHNESFEAVDLSTLIQQVGVPKHITIADRESTGWGDQFAIYAFLTNSFDEDTLEPDGDTLIESSSVMAQYPTIVHLPVIFDGSTGRLYLVICASSYNYLEITAYY